jgi:AcrR family transcriptional regulator
VANLRVPGAGQRGGLRERKKLAVRRALGSAAVRLAVERGPENVTIEDITAEADLSLRTFGNYFSSKYEAICAPGTDRARRIGAELLARPAREPLWVALVNAVLAHYEDADAEWLAWLRLVVTAPALHGEYLKVTAEMQQALAEAIATRTGIDMEQDTYPQVLAGAVTAAAQVAVGRWAAADPPGPLRPLLGRALDQLACSAGAGRYLTEEEFQALVRPAIFGPNGPLREPPGSGEETGTDEEHYPRPKPPPPSPPHPPPGPHPPRRGPRHR